ncbi:transposase [Streptomyces sp. NPDC055140]
MEGHRRDVLRTASARSTASCRGARPSRGPLLPPAPERRLRHPGRLHVPDRAALADVMYVVRTGVTWRDVPAERVGCSGVTAWRRPAGSGRLRRGRRTGPGPRRGSMSAPRRSTAPTPAPSTI